MAELTPATGFWSYAHSDDLAMAGHVLELAEEVARIYFMKTCETLKIFVDRKDIQWSQNWRNLISTSILGTTFFFPIITPNYLRSPNCRAEFDEFWTAATKSKVPKLLLPIIYEDVDHLNSTDPICRIAREFQLVDWRTTKLEDKTSSLYRKLLNKMGVDLVAAAVQAANTPEPPEEEIAKTPTPETDGTTTTPEVPDQENGDDEGDEGGVPPAPGPTDKTPPGLLEAMVRVEELTAEFTEGLAKTKEAVDQVGSEITREPPPKNATAGQRLFYVNAISKRMQEPAARFEAEAKNLEQLTRELTDIVLTVAQDMANPVFAEGARRANIEGMLQIRDKVKRDLGDIDQARDAVVAVGRMSRQLKEPVSAVLRGFDSFDAIKEMLLSWASAFEPLMKSLAGGSGSGETTQADSSPSPSDPQQ